MLPRLLFITLYITQIIFFTHGQNVQTMLPQDSCVSTTISFHCPNKYVPIVRTAFYGIAAKPGACSYTPGDCIADAMNIMTCTTDLISCDVYLTRRKLSQCNDQYADYLRAEFDCVPISMTDAAKTYDICQSTVDITSDHGIITSPGYPTQFQTTTTECFRAIHVPDDKVIRLWLTDLYIGSTSTNCADDHVYVVDNIHNYRHCGLRRFAYPDLCSTTIIIQYLVTTDISTYRGMRMYFEIADRPADDACPNANGTVTPIPATTPRTSTITPDTTTPIPPYVTLGIASPVRSFQLCPGESYRVNCPDNYVFTVLTNIFGVTLSGQCETRNPETDCIITSDPTFMCQQTCVYTYTGHHTLLSCNNKTANYQYVEYQCIPTNTELVSNVSCPASGSTTVIPFDQRGRFQSCNYPTLQTTNYTYQLTAKYGHSLHFYALDISLNGFIPNCQSNKLILVDHDDMQTLNFCEQRSYSLLFSSCSNVVDLIFTVTNPGQEFSRGAELYIESEPRPSYFVCKTPLSTTSIAPTPPPTSVVISTVTPPKNDTMFAQPEREHDICFNEVLNGACPAGYTFMIVNAFYGIKQDATSNCGFVQGDCVQEALSTITQCYTDLATCYIFYGTRRRLAQCSDNYADYLHITSQCVPSENFGGMSSLKVYNICDSQSDLKGFHGVITSPNFPSFKQTNDECRVKIDGILDRVLKIWINELAIGSGGQRSSTDDFDANEPDLVIYKNSDTNNIADIEQMFPSIRDTCPTDYLMIDTPHIVYIYCGTRKVILAPICANSVDIRYKTTSAPNLFYKGFKLYYEWVEKPMGVICGGDPQTGNTTTPDYGPLPMWAQNLELSPIMTEMICFGTSKILQCPRGSDYVLSIVSSNYVATGSGLCDIPADSHCHQEISLGLTCTHSCLVEYIIPIPLGLCGSKDADYIIIDYECIPTRLPNNENPHDICASTPTDIITTDVGMMISPQYPTLTDTRTCSKKIQTLDYKLWMVFIVDLFLEGENNGGQCNGASLTIYDGVDRIVRCGLHQPELVLVSCSHIVEITLTTNHYAVGYRGFKVYYQTIDVPPGWGCVPVGFTTVKTTTTPVPPITTTLVPPSLQIWTYGGTTNGTRQYCKFPFIYQGNEQTTCLATTPPNSTSGQDPQGPWCSITDNFDRDHQWGFCELGITGTTFYDICHSQWIELKCPVGYVIDILTADHAARPDGDIDPSSCSYDPDDCFQSDATFIQSRCAGYPTCYIFHTERTLTTCQNRRSAYLHIQYTCVPNNIPSITTYDICNSGAVIPSDARRGFIVSPNFPSSTSNINCKFDIQVPQQSLDIYLYIVEMELESTNGTGSACMKDRFIFTADNVVNEICGRSFTNFLAYTCHDSISLQLIRESGAAGRGVKLYFEFRDKPVWQLCPSLPTTTTQLTLSPTVPTTTTSGPLPNYYPNPSPRDITTLCFQDRSGLMGTKTLQCPSGYILVIHRAFYGHNAQNLCQHRTGDCIHEADIVYRTCAGQQSCSVSFLSGILISECNDVQANYLAIEYQCLPTLSIASKVSDLCNGTIDTAGISGIFVSSSYPTYAQSQCVNTTLTSLTASNLVIHMYLLDLDIGLPHLSSGNCTDDYLSLSYECNQQLYQQTFCGTYPTELLFSTCAPTDHIFASFNLISQNPQNRRGFALLYHLAPKVDSTTLFPTTPRTTTEVTPSGPGPLSTPVQLLTVCAISAHTVSCDQPDYVLVIHKVQLGVSATDTCVHSPNDCFEDRTSSYYHCGGKPSCDLLASAITIVACNSSRSNYLSAEYQCIPTRPKHYVDLCTYNQSYERVVGGAIVASLDYTPEPKNCTALLRSDKLFGSQDHKAFKIYILSLSLPTRATLREQGAQCSDHDPYIEIDDHEISPTRLCGLSHTRYLGETCSTMIEVRFYNTYISTETVQYRGFELYFESIQNNECRKTPAPIIPTDPFVIERRVACATGDNFGRVDFMCTANYGLVFLQSYYFVTTEPTKCDVTNYTCHYPSEQPAAQCAGQYGCSFTHIISDETESSVCQQKPNAVEFYFQCLPMTPSESYPKHKFCETTFISEQWGFIETPDYPYSYIHIPGHCELTIQFPDNQTSDDHVLYLYVMELRIRDTSALNSTSTITCYDSIEYTDGIIKESICGKIDEPILKFHTRQKQLNLTLNITQPSSHTEWSTWRGARLFFFIDNQTAPSPPVTTAPPDVISPSTKPTPGSNSHELTIALVTVGVVLILGALLAFAYYRRRNSSDSNIPTISYGVEMDAVDGTTPVELEDKRTSIPRASLSGSSSFVTPFYSKSGTNGINPTYDETDA